MLKLFSLSHLDNCISNFLADSGGTTALWEPSYMDEWHSVKRQAIVNMVLLWFWCVRLVNKIIRHQK
jgi:hypothetical protein